MALTPLARLVEERLRQAGHIGSAGTPTDLTGWIAGQRKAEATWEDIALDVRIATGERVTAETLRTWHPKPPSEEPAP